ncbi:MAG: 1-acyl-sn-glycerol-3-phosphate acyltransferase [Lachnospiraceae bacterium]|nr:1-acyl-sn-glycerol-3-phosphate acyltransferase [Lachnospiraceae bacterium]
MNLLAEVQKKLFEPGMTEQERCSREQDFLKLYYDLRRKDESSLLGRMSLKTRKRLHKLILIVYTIKNHMGGFSYELIGDKREKTNRPIIFAVTHVGKFDIEVVSEAIKDHYYLLSGDYEHIQGTIDAPFLALSGVIYFNERVREDRKSVSQRMINHLQAGGNLMYFPEGTWNMTPNLPMLPCYWGIVEIAQKGNAIIVPVAADQYGKKYKINIGTNFDMVTYGKTIEEKAKAITDLRDVLATLKWEIWETEPQKRDNLTGYEWDKYCEERFHEWPYFNLKYIDRLVFKPKGIFAPREVFSYMDNLVPRKENVFLFKKAMKN